MTASPDAVYCIDRLGRIVYANDEAFRQLGRTAEEVSSILFCDLDLLPCRSWAQVWNEISASGAASFDCKSGISPQLHGPVRLTAHHFRIREQEYAIVLVRYRMGGDQGPASLLDTPDTLRAIFEGAETGILIIDPQNHRSIDANSVALRLIGTSRRYFSICW